MREIYKLLSYKNCGEHCSLAKVCPPRGVGTGGGGGGQGSQGLPNILPLRLY